MTITFYKYHGTGNDFILIDNRLETFPKTDLVYIEQLCNRRFGIGADGLILLENDATADFKMVYFNSDGNESTMCGNGGRCLVAFAKKLGIINEMALFNAVDGKHNAHIAQNGIVSLQMKDVNEIEIAHNYVFLNTGSPHYVTLVNDSLTHFQVKASGAAIRYSEQYKDGGTNVNFVNQISENHFRLRTYERGVEDETLSCGTGATATAIAMNVIGKTNSNTIQLDVEGGKLKVVFDKDGLQFTNVNLIGPASFVFNGSVSYNKN